MTARNEKSIGGERMPEQSMLRTLLLSAAGRVHEAVTQMDLTTIHSISGSQLRQRGPREISGGEPVVRTWLKPDAFGEPIHGISELFLYTPDKSDESPYWKDGYPLFTIARVVPINTKDNFYFGITEDEFYEFAPDELVKMELDIDPAEFTSRITFGLSRKAADADDPEYIAPDPAYATKKLGAICEAADFYKAYTQPRAPEGLVG